MGVESTKCRCGYVVCVVPCVRCVVYLIDAVPSDSGIDGPKSNSPNMFCCFAVDDDAVFAFDLCCRDDAFTDLTAF